MKNVKASSLIITLLLIILSGAAIFAIYRVPESNPLSQEIESVSGLTEDGTEAKADESTKISELAEKIAADEDSLSVEMLTYCGENFGAAVLESVFSAIGDGTYTSDMWHTLTGNTPIVISDMMSGAIKNDKSIHLLDGSDDGNIEIGFVGDINLADSWNLMQHYKTTAGLSECLSPELIKMMNDVNIMFANNEFAFSAGGEAQKGKSYTFRSDPKNVSILRDLGIDIVSTANNHIYDYGSEAFNDTFDTLDKAGIAHVGAGKSLDEASAASYFIVNGRKIAFVAAGETYPQYRTPAAKKDKEGILPVETKTEAVAAVKAAAAKSDYVIMYAHWGYENLSWYSDEQVDLARAFIDAGADFVVGSHPHVLQGMEFYKDKLIAYSLGNFWFNTKTMNTGLLKLTIDKGGNITPVFHPCLQSGGVTTLLTDGKEKEKVFYFVESHSRNWGIDIKDDGIITKAK
ncbi:MAG: CapA family protein [Clostridiales bacterium]|jgi:poly-gamma-glutamate synthesis protein (capsule biosynthesis protein)|nr:CapA family protein [Clostridiales bacterium]